MEINKTINIHNKFIEDSSEMTIFWTSQHPCTPATKFNQFLKVVISLRKSLRVRKWESAVHCHN